MRKNRKFKLIDPRFQLSWVALALLAAGFCLVIQSVILVLVLGEVAQDLPRDGRLLQESLPSALFKSVGLSALSLFPFLAYICVLMTYRVAGPVYRMKMYLRGVLAGKQQGDCFLREHDEFKELCSLINEVVAMKQQPSVQSDRERAA